ncbi:hypothetical protein AB0M22_27790 [Nocardia sp. NPDC051756]|uniref:hypothetical protein n=1 Tax=Nocardia sp. NPDC051756 TaxID=3154751 RepID=UPI0034196666
MARAGDELREEVVALRGPIPIHAGNEDAVDRLLPTGTDPPERRTACGSPTYRSFRMAALGCDRFVCFIRVTAISGDLSRFALPSGDMNDGRIAVEINREDVQPMTGPGRGRKGARAGVLLATGLLSVSALGYGILAAPSSTAADETGPYTCEGVQGKVKLAKGDNGGYTLSVDMADVEVKSGQDSRCKKDENATKAEAKTKSISAKETDDGCEFTGTANAKDDDAESASDTKFTLTVPPGGKPAKVEVTGKLYSNSTDKDKDEVKATGTVKGVKLESCEATAIPEGTYSGMAKVAVTPG